MDVIELTSTITDTLRGKDATEQDGETVEERREMAGTTQWSFASARQRSASQSWGGQLSRLGP